jgi:hypothetical protein
LILGREVVTYRHLLPEPWKNYSRLPSVREVRRRWASLYMSIDGGLE